MSETPHDSLEASRAEKLRAIEDLGLDPWGGRFDGVEPIATVRLRPAPTFEQNPDGKLRTAGRVVLRRTMGKAHFLTIADQTGKVQIWIGAKQVGEENWKLAQLLDLGDLIGVNGVLGTTRTGEITVRADAITMLAKSLEPHPDKWAGMQDTEFRLRHRYLDLIYTPDTLRRAQQRVQIVRTIRRHLDAQGFSEVETPTLHATAGGAAARPFATHHNTLDLDLVLRIALELHLKRLLVGGLERVYEIGRVFRNEGISRKHNPEFTMLELYQAYGDYRSMMDLTEGLVVACINAIAPEANRKLSYNGQEIDFTPPWPRQTYADLLKQHVGVDMADEAAVSAAAAAKGFGVAGKDHAVLVQFLFEESVEDKLSGPVFVCDYPAPLCPLTKRQRGNPAIAERFELYVRGMELANAYTELNDPITQEAAFRAQLAGMPADESMARMDDDFVRALRHGMPPAGGLGIGIDRLVMLLTDSQAIGDVILFPLLRPEKT